jgi:hypothetical protein
MRPDAPAHRVRRWVAGDFLSEMAAGVEEELGANSGLLEDNCDGKPVALD